SELCGTRRVDAPLCRGERARERLALCACLRLLALELRELVRQALRSEVRALCGEACRLALEAPQLTLELLEACALNLGTALGGSERGGVRFPALLPLLQRLLGELELPRGVTFRLLRRGALGLEPRELLAHRGQLSFVGPEGGGKFSECRLRLRQIVTLPLAQLARVLDRLLEARDVRAHFVIARLHGGESVGVRGVQRALLLDGGLGSALCSELALHGELALAQRGVVHLGAAVEIAQA